ncbi:MAG TPA: hypothetical protein VF331_19625 [Polyangiales bacterium]
MRKWLALGLLGLVVAWGPYLYAELRRSPVLAHGSARRVLAAADNEATEAAGRDAPKPAEPPDKAAEPSKAQPAAQEPPKAAESDQVGKIDKAAAGDQPQPSAAAKKTEPSDTKEAHAAGDEPPVVAPHWPSELVPAFRAAFEAEPRDGFWAADEEPRLGKLFHGAGVALADVSEVACRKTVCRVIWNAAASDAEEANKLYAALHDGYGSGLALDSKQAERDEHAALYVLRKGYQLETGAH